MTPIPRFRQLDIEARFAGFAEPGRAALLALRRLIFQVAATTPGVGVVQETLKWGQPAYLTPETKSGSTLRLGPVGAEHIALYVHCQTTILNEFRGIFPDDFTYEGTRAVHLRAACDLPLDKLRLLIGRALTYHRRRPA